MIRAITILTLSITLFSCAQTIKGDGNVVMEERPMEQFNVVKTSGVFTINLIEGDPKVTIKTDQNLLEHIETKVSGDRLTISSSDKFLDAEVMEIDVYYVNLEEISVSGAAQITASNTINGKRLELNVSGAAEADLDLRLEEFAVNVGGGADLDLTGYANEVTYDLSGAAEINAGGLKSSIVKIEVSGASELEVDVQDELDVEISGAGEVKYRGNPTVSQDISGAGELVQVK